MNIKVLKEKWLLRYLWWDIYVEKINNDFVLTNGDIISDIKFDEILEFHKNSLADATMAVQPYYNEIPFWCS